MKLELRDFFFAPAAGRAGGPSADPEIRQRAASSQGLKVTFVASHAGMKNQNNVMYSPAGMKNSTVSWVYPQQRRVQIHHDDKADPIGQVITARYEPYGEATVPKGYRDAVGHLQDAGTKKEILEAAEFLQDSGVLNQSTWRGVGELVLEAIVSDSDAIQKILDGRYHGISISQRPKQAFCSICHQDWIKDGKCDHVRGEVDEETEKSMFLVVGGTRYTEASYVNQPADEFAQTKSAEHIELDPLLPPLADSLANFDGGAELLQASELEVRSFKLIDSLDEEIMTKEAKELADELGAETVPKPAEEEISDGLEKPVEVEDAPALEEGAEDEPKEADGKEPDPEATLEEALRLLFEAEEDLTPEMVDAIRGAVFDLVEGDAKLSTKQRKALAPSQFCGPQESFPVNDCAHYTAAKRLIGKYKGPGDKTKIMSCVNTKGKALGCPTAKKKGDDEEPEGICTECGRDTVLNLSSLADEELIEKHLEAEKLMVDRKLHLPRTCKECEEKDAELKEANELIPDLEETVRILRKEWQDVTFEHRASEESHQDTLVELEATLVGSVTNHRLLTDKESSEEEIQEQVKAMSLDDLRKAAKEIDLSEVISSARSGLSQEPEGEIDASDVEPDEVVVDEDQRKIAETLVKFMKDYPTAMAQSYLEQLVKRGKLPEDFTLDKASDLVAE